MSPASEAILSAAMALPESERLDLAAALLSNSEPPVPEPRRDEWLAELTRRSEESRVEGAVFSPWSEVKSRVRAVIQ